MQNLNVNEGVCVVEVSSCILCGNSGVVRYTNLRDRLFNSPGFYTVIECPACSLLWLSPRPFMEDIQKIYPKPSNGHLSPNIIEYHGMRSILKNAILATKFHYTKLPSTHWQKIVGKMISILRPLRKKVELSIMYLNGRGMGRLLDVGCSTGEFLVKMRNLGWEVFGVDIDKNAIKIARDHNRLGVFEGTLEQARFSDNTFDAVTMSHVIEHIADPVQTLKETYRVLKPGGQLVITTPNMYSLCHKIFGSSYYHLDIPRHFYIFSPHSIRSCVERAGLKILKLNTFSKDLISTYQASKGIQKNGRLDGYYVKKRNGIIFQSITGCLLQGPVNVASRFKDIGEEIVVIAKKPILGK
ncbi:MAG: Malonyl-(acyl-carrier protein) O-methyltransferase [candidate division WS2 bacterium]|nr:Malonyl-(acyl-carrier protein) O-methyltransferase [Candidatus Lithacetigena glycinireducens]